MASLPIESCEHQLVRRHRTTEENRHIGECAGRRFNQQFRNVFVQRAVNDDANRAFVRFMRGDEEHAAAEIRVEQIRVSDEQLTREVLRPFHRLAHDKIENARCESASAFGEELSYTPREAFTDRQDSEPVLRFAFKPGERGGRDKFLRVVRQMGQQRMTSSGIEFTKNVVDQEKGSACGIFGEDLGLRKLAGRARSCAVGPRKQIGPRASSAPQIRSSPVRSDCRHAKALFFASESRADGWRNLRRNQVHIRAESFSFAADRVLTRDRIWLQSIHEIGPHFSQQAAGADQRFRVSLQFLGPRPGRFQKCVTRAKRAFVSAQSWPIARVYLTANKIEIASPQFGRAADKVEVVISEGNDPGEAQIFRVIVLFDPIKSQPFAAADCRKIGANVRRHGRKQRMIAVRREPRARDWRSAATANAAKRRQPPAASFSRNRWRQR